jgi:hypothetical protein
MGVLEVIIISLMVIFFFAVTGVSGFSRIIGWIIASVERVLFNNIVEDEDDQQKNGS